MDGKNNREQIMNWIKEDEELFSNDMKQPDARKHQIVSFIKSGIRIAGYLLMFVNIPIAAVVLVLSEIVGIWEELV